MSAPRIYPWESWLKRRRFTLLRGRDYACSASAMTQMLRNLASQANLQAHVVEVEGGVTVLLKRRKRAKAAKRR